MSDRRHPQILPSKKPVHTLERYSEADLPTEQGSFHVVVFRDRRDRAEHVALIVGDVAGREGVPVRVHSECLTGEVFGSMKCDCRQQLDRALEFVSQNKCGIVLYLRQEGRGIGLGDKIKAYALQAEGMDTYEANRHLGYPDDLRTYDVAAEMLRSLGVGSVDLITNNPLKIAGLVDGGVPVRRRIPLPIQHNPHNREYLKAKQEHSGHLFEMFPDDPNAKAG